MPDMKQHYALIGIALVADEYPLYFDAANEKGLGMAGLNYPDNFKAFDVQEGKDNVTPFEFIPWVLGQCASVDEAKKLLTNNPQFLKQLTNLDNYASLSPAMPVNTFSKEVNFNGYSRGLSSHNLPGGMDSESRFVRVAFNKFNAPKHNSEEENVDTYFHILHSVEQQKGLDEVAPNQFEYTTYSDGTNLDTGAFYYTSYNKRITKVDLHKENLDSDKLITYPINDKIVFDEEN